MDPNATLRIIHEQAGAFYALPGEVEFDATVFVDAVAALDEWLRNGGFLPNAWQR